MAVFAITIGGVSKQIQPGWTITESANARGRLTCAVKSLDGSYRPAIDAEVIITEDGIRIFGGVIDRPSEQGLVGSGKNSGIVTTVNAADFNVLADRRHVTEEIPSGTLKAALLVIEPYLTDYGVSLDAAQVNGPTLPALSYTNRKLRDVLNELSDLSNGYVWEIDYNKVLRMFEPGTRLAPFDLTNPDQHAVGDITVEPSRSDYANYIILLAGTGTRDVSDTLGTGDGVTTAFPLHYTLANFYGYVTNGATNETLDLAGMGATWTYDPPTNTVTRVSPPTSGNAIVMPYVAQFPQTVIADGGAPSANRVEKIIQAPDVFDLTVAQALADSYLARDSATPKTVRYTALIGQTALHPGQKQVITVTKRGLSGNFLISDVQIRNVVGNYAQRTVTATGGLRLPANWRDTVKQWSMSGTGASSAAGTVTIVSAGGVGGAGTPGAVAQWATANTLEDATAVPASLLTGTLAYARLPSGVGTWSASPTIAGGVTISSTSPYLALHESDQAVDAKFSRFMAENGNIQLQAINDAGSSILSVPLSIARATGAADFASTVNAVSGYRVNNAAASGTFLRGNGTNYLASTLTLPNTATINRIPYATAADVWGDSAALRFDGTTLTTTDLAAVNVTGANANMTNGYKVNNLAPSGTVLRGNGTNFVASTLTLPNTATTNRIPYATGSNAIGESASLTFDGTTFTTNALAATSVSSSLIPTSTDTYDLGSVSKLWNQAYISQINAVVFAQTTATLFGGYSIVGKNAGSFAADVASAATTINFGQTMTPGDYVLVRAHDTSGSIKAEYITVQTLVSGTTYNVLRDRNGIHSPDPAWASGTPFLVLGAPGDGRIEMLAFDGKPRIVFTTQGASHNTQNDRAVIGNLNTYYGYATDVYGAAFGDPAAANLTVDATNGLRIRNGTTDYAKLASGTLTVGAAGGNRLAWDGTNLTLVSQNLTIDSAGVAMVPSSTFSNLRAYRFTRASGGFGQAGDIFGLGASSGGSVQYLELTNTAVGTGASSDADAEVIVTATGWDASANAAIPAATLTLKSNGSGLTTVSALLTARDTVTLDTAALSVTGTITERGRTKPAGEYTPSTPTRTATAGTWTGGTVTTFQYRIIGKSMKVDWFITGSSVSNAGVELRLGIPDGYVSNVTLPGIVGSNNAGAGNAISLAQVDAGGTVIRLFSSIAAGTFGIAAGTTVVFGSIEFEVQ